MNGVMGLVPASSNEDLSGEENRVLHLSEVSAKKINLKYQGLNRIQMFPYCSRRYKVLLRKKNSAS